MGKTGILLFFASDKLHLQELTNRISTPWIEMNLYSMHAQLKLVLTPKRSRL